MFIQKATNLVAFFLRRKGQQLIDQLELPEVYAIRNLNGYGIYIIINKLFRELFKHF